VAFQLQREERGIAPWKPIVQAEQGQLMQELRAAGVDYLH